MPCVSTNTALNSALTNRFTIARCFCLASAERRIVILSLVEVLFLAFRHSIQYIYLDTEGQHLKALDPPYKSDYHGQKPWAIWDRQSILQRLPKEIQQIEFLCAYTKWHRRMCSRPHLHTKPASFEFKSQRSSSGSCRSPQRHSVEPW